MFIKLTKFRTNRVAYSDHGEPIWINSNSIVSISAAPPLMVITSEDDYRTPTAERRKEPSTRIAFAFATSDDEAAELVCETVDEVLRCLPRE